MEPQIRKIVTYKEIITSDGGKEAEQPLVLFGAAAVIKNPWAGRGFVEDLMPEIRVFGPKMGQILTDQMLELGGGGDTIEALGKASMVGLDGELEHASAIIHTVNYGNVLRKAVGGTAYLGFTSTRGPGNTQLNIPLMDKNDTGRRSHYLTVQMHIHDAPADQELIVAFGGSTGGRPHHRIGDRYSDLAAIGADLDNPAGV
ncbi:MAG: amino acid synthesis family protein [Alphaproteobacteria bacterium]|nr:amino acid synthesis family protein [Alphaproteobacteria bacterium]MDA8675274.1 amino acid synthesis family protein [Alphaproteobacteria bacterium]